MDRSELRERIEDLQHEYVACIDEDRLEQWPDFFTERCIYKVIPWENQSLGLPLALIFCDSRGMLKDRVTAHREANMFAPHLYRHLVSAIRILGEENGVVRVSASYAVFRTMTDPIEFGATAIYSTGEYRDKVIFEDGKAKFAEKIVVTDTCRVGSLLVTPI